MSLIYKVILLFFVSFTLMLYLSNETNTLTQSTIEKLLKEKYIQVSEELFTYLSNNDTVAIEKKVSQLNFQILKDKKHYLEVSTSLYEYKTDLSSIKILKHEDNKYLLYMNYLDDDILVMDLSQNKIFQDKEFLNYMILADIVILILFSLIILKMIYPLKEISNSIKKFGEGNYASRVDKQSNDEIGELSKRFNSMALNIEELITSRQRLLRDVGHELKTPISKAKLAVEMMEENKYTKVLKKALSQMDEMTSELLYIEKLNANQHKFNFKKFNCETLISESLSKLFIEDETSVDVAIESNFDIYADLNYLSIALKNLIDNGLKYGTQKPLLLLVKERKIFVKSRGDALEKPLEFYCEDFTQGESSRSKSGYGLGLSLVKRVLEKHNFKFSYQHGDGWNAFIIEF